MKVRVLLCIASLAATSPLAAQQPTAQQQATQPVVAPVVAPAAPLPGPRVRTEFRPVESSIRDGISAFHEDGRHTITISTLALVLAVVILVLLIVR